ncbi:auxin-responsive protein SAUR32-like [Ziziphus jujuba]|uniref:Auxin-responsive protein SAUR32-like n=1 Tax=Ziziphus jujuba TaxID=326968 RepID=A0A6P3Z743_ZIZJJ|nr:auxin-responsive protein SAUR32-like [Ziziphus jujuba]
MKNSAKEGHQKQQATTTMKRRVAPQGCFTVYVGPQKLRFVIKTQYANHPLFMKLLEEAESEYGYNSHGPLVLPCNVDVFYKVLMKMEGEDREVADGKGGGFGSRPCPHASYQYLSPFHLYVVNQI